MAEEIVKIDKMEHSTSLRCVNQLTGRQQELYWQFVSSAFFSSISLTLFEINCSFSSI